MTKQTDVPNYRKLIPGDRVPSFKARTTINPRFTFDSMGGRWLVLAFPGMMTNSLARNLIGKAYATEGVFDDVNASLFVISNDKRDETGGLITDRLPGHRVFWDHDLAVSRLYGALPAEPGGQQGFRAMWMVIDPALTLRKVVPMAVDGTCLEQVLAYLRSAPAPVKYLGFAVPPPILILPDVFEPAFCDRLIELHRQSGGESSGFMREESGKTVVISDTSFKVRRDHTITDPDLIRETHNRIVRKVVPQIERVHFFKCTRMERYMIGCYPADEGGHFQPHRDNTTPGTAHRRFAVSINLNDDFDGGYVRFPEYSPKGFKAPKGGAVIFSCSLLHAVSRVTQGSRYAFLPFLYDEAAAAIRVRNAETEPNTEGDGRAI